MFWKIKINGKPRRVSFWKWLAYTNQEKLDKVMEKLDKLCQGGDKRSDDEERDDEEKKKAHERTYPAR